MPTQQPVHKTLSALAFEGAIFGAQFADHATPAPDCTLRIVVARARANRWPVEDVKFLAESVRGLIAVASAQLNGAGRLLATFPINLHPLATITRGIA
ncbi:MAG: hypothetical protein M3P01_13175, partial [Actinomycetota bacterium]|nr:hypothetical protein [Actinomycetota bacterium]